MHALQLDVAAHITEVARDEHEVDRRSVDLRDGGPQQGIGRTAGRYVHIGQESEIQLHGVGCNGAQRTTSLHAEAQQQGRREQKHCLLSHKRDVLLRKIANFRQTVNPATQKTGCPPKGTARTT